MIEEIYYFVTYVIRMSICQIDDYKCGYKDVYTKYLLNVVFLIFCSKSLLIFDLEYNTQ